MKFLCCSALQLSRSVENCVELTGPQVPSGASTLRSWSSAVPSLQIANTVWLRVPYRFPSSRCVTGTRMLLQSSSHSAGTPAGDQIHLLSGCTQYHDCRNVREHLHRCRRLACLACARYIGWLRPRVVVEDGKNLSPRQVLAVQIRGSHGRLQQPDPSPHLNPSCSGDDPPTGRLCRSHDEHR